MTLILSGTNGLSDVDGSASTPAIRGTDTNTGMFFPAADTIAFAEGGAEVARFDSAGNVGIGTSSPSYKLDVSGEIRTTSHVRGTGSDVLYVIGGASNNNNNIYVGGSSAGTANTIAFTTAGSERARIDSSGNLLVGTTNATGDGAGLELRPALENGGFITIKKTSLVSGNKFINFVNTGSGIGSISANGTTAVAYNTTSDYRLKKNVVPLTGALAKVQALKPSGFEWIDGRPDDGFIAHELQQVLPNVVTGDKDAVDEDGKPVYQQVDYARIVATLTAAIQEQQALIESLTARIAALEAA